jgi:hypothetical protein
MPPCKVLLGRPIAVMRHLSRRIAMFLTTMVASGIVAGGANCEDSQESSFQKELIYAHQDFICSPAIFECADISMKSCREAVSASVKACPIRDFKAAVDAAVEEGTKSSASMEQAAKAFGHCLPESVRLNLGLETDEEIQCFNESLERSSLNFIGERRREVKNAAPR